MGGLISLFLTIAFWVLIAYAWYATEELRVPAIFVAIWLVAFGLPYLLPSLYTVGVIVRYVLPVLITVWLKIRDLL